MHFLINVGILFIILFCFSLFIVRRYVISHKECKLWFTIQRLLFLQENWSRKCKQLAPAPAVCVQQQRRDSNHQPSNRNIHKHPQNSPPQRFHLTGSYTFGFIVKEQWIVFLAKDTERNSSINREAVRHVSKMWFEKKKRRAR